MNKKTWFLISAVLVLVSFIVYSQSTTTARIQERQKREILVIKKRPLLRLAHRFDIQGIKRIYTSPTKVIFQVQYYISPTYPKPCFISAYMPNKTNQQPGFSFLPAGRLPDGVPKGQKHFVDDVKFEVHYSGSAYTSSTIEVVIYDAEKNLTTEILNWGQTWGSAGPQVADLIISSISVSKYSPYVKTTFTVNVKNIGGAAAGAADISVWLYFLLPDGSEPATPNEYWSGTVPMGGGTIAPGATKAWTHDKYEFMVEGNWRVRAKVNPFKGVTESNYNNNSYTYNFTLPN